MATLAVVLLGAWLGMLLAFGSGDAPQLALAGDSPTVDGVGTSPRAAADPLAALASDLREHLAGAADGDAAPLPLHEPLGASLGVDESHGAELPPLPPLASSRWPRLTGAHPGPRADFRSAALRRSERPPSA